MTTTAPLTFVTTSQPTLERIGRPDRLGRLFTPSCVASVYRTSQSMPWAADNGCFNGLDYWRWTAMLDRLQDYASSCTFAAVADVVGDAFATLQQWRLHSREVLDRGLPAAFVLQDGASRRSVPWSEISAVFVGGTTDFKVGADARELVEHARSLGLWVHMGRVNTRERFRYAAEIGCDSVDGSSFGRFPRNRIPALLSWADELEAELLAA